MRSGSNRTRLNFLRNGRSNYTIRYAISYARQRESYEPSNPMKCRGVEESILTSCLGEARPRRVDPGQYSSVLIREHSGGDDGDLVRRNISVRLVFVSAELSLKGTAAVVVALERGFHHDRVFRDHVQSSGISY